MDLQKARELAESLIQSGTTHQDYKRTVEHARDYLAFISGEGIDDMLKKFVPRESDVMFEQRKQLTQAITPAVCSSLIKPFYKVGRNDKVKQIIEVKNSPNKEEAIKKMMLEFFGDSRKQKGLNYWLKTRFVELSFSDPNSWVVIEWENPGLQATPKPYPVEVSADEAIWFEFKNGILQQLLIRKEIQYLAVDKRYKNAIYKKGIRYTLYDIDRTVVYTQVDKDFLKQNDLLSEMELNGTIVEIKGITYSLTEYLPNLGYVPAFRIGYTRDIATKGRTFVSPLKPAEAYLRKSIKTVSELDLSMTLHAFPQKIQYVDPCPGESPQKRCWHGKLEDGSTCGECKGSGKKVHTSAQDAIYLAMPEQGQQNVINLDNILVYKAPPTDLLNFQKEYTESLKKESHIAVFNSQVFVQTETAKTATEVEDNMESIYDTLEPFTDQISAIFIEIVGTFAGILDVKPEDEDVNIIHRYPADPKLKNTAILLNELKLVNESKAPAFLRDAITNDIASIIYNGDPLGWAKYNTRRKFYPFNGKTNEEINLLLNSSYIAERTKVLAANFDLIFNDIEKENPGFSLMTNDNEQWKIVEEVVDRYVLEINDSKVEDIKPNFGALTDTEDE